MTTYPASYYKSQANTYHTRWVDALRETKDITEPSSKEAHYSYLKDLYLLIAKFYQQNHQYLDAISKSQMEHALSRHISEHIALSKGDDIIPVFRQSFK